MRLALEIYMVPGIGEIGRGDDLITMIAEKCGSDLRNGDIVAISSKIVSKSEGRTAPVSRREQVITAETVRVVAEKKHAAGITKIVENRLGIVGAAAGVDSSNCEPGTVLLLPSDPDASARAVRTALQDQFGLELGVLIKTHLAGHGESVIPILQSGQPASPSSMICAARPTRMAGRWKRA